MEVVAQENVKAAADGQVVPVKFTYIPETPGEYKLTLEAVPQPGELVDDQQPAQHLRPRAQGRAERVVHRRGAARRAEVLSPGAGCFARHPRRLRAAGPAAARDPARPTWPSYFQPGKYEVYILGDVDSTAFHERSCSELAEAVNRGAGLIMLGGFHSFGPAAIGNAAGRRAAGGDGSPGAAAASTTRSAATCTGPARCT